ncbi:MAG: AbrB/MazE/SpoVT family DNA-binding domain-containing protein [Patescibacteria group bacterium]
MQLPQPFVQDETWIKILPKGLITIPKKIREKLSIKEGDVAQINISRNSIVIKPRESVEYRLFTNKEIRQWVKDDKLPVELAKKAQAIWSDIP